MSVFLATLLPTLLIITLLVFAFWQCFILYVRHRMHKKEKKLKRMDIKPSDSEVREEVYYENGKIKTKKVKSLSWYQRLFPW